MIVDYLLNLCKFNLSDEFGLKYFVASSEKCYSSSSDLRT